MPDWLDTPADAVVVLTLFSILMGGLVWVIKAQISMQKEFKPNGGSSTRDQLNRIEHKIDNHIHWHLERTDSK